MTTPTRNWHEQHKASMPIGQRIADSVAAGMGSWRFIIGQSIFIIAWITFNIVAVAARWDIYPFILLNLIFSTQAAYAAPIIMMSQNRSSARDRVQAQHDYDTNVAAKKEIEALSKVNAQQLEILNSLKVLIAAVDSEAVALDKMRTTKKRQP